MARCPTEDLAKFVVVCESRNITSTESCNEQALSTGQRVALILILHSRTCEVRLRFCLARDDSQNLLGRTCFSRPLVCARTPLEVMLERTRIESYPRVRIYSRPCRSSVRYRRPTAVVVTEMPMAKMDNVEDGQSNGYGKAPD